MPMRPQISSLEFETLDGIWYRSSQGYITQTTNYQWETTHGYAATMDALTNAERMANAVDWGCTKTDILCRFIINAGPNQIELPECFLSEVDEKIHELLTDSPK